MSSTRASVMASSRRAVWAGAAEASSMAQPSMPRMKPSRLSAGEVADAEPRRAGQAQRGPRAVQATECPGIGQAGNRQVVIELRPVLRGWPMGAAPMPPAAWTQGATRSKTRRYLLGEGLQGPPGGPLRRPQPMAHRRVDEDEVVGLVHEEARPGYRRGAGTTSRYSSRRCTGQRGATRDVDAARVHATRRGRCRARSTRSSKRYEPGFRTARDAFADHVDRSALRERLLLAGHRLSIVSGGVRDLAYRQGARGACSMLRCPATASSVNGEARAGLLQRKVEFDRGTGR